ncbi:putative plasma membrane osmosensor that activates the high osmolarity glycerol (HOG) MAPK signaling pathway in response to high osmolarity [Lyophyllum shimeji]|uniref:Plasma membrane osmosensor that activates the high osmolarity glycerol (HOG) MAPK signaling pathway in response to high osmolarity n=1 Tax=Lyophyllum shimeji TaxID=47721 RepID=A0A9P3ULL5_LYOSH|nr:putative plasma membrane osmosensor that activates the high osmolarity glycerol (HOG) MAPK signaling pathway in response to high osmolarity [Lyophyllum shimeji]
MPPRGNEGLDFTPILTHYLFLFTTILAIIGWFVAFVGQAVATARTGNGQVGVLWFSIFLQLFLILGVIYTLASDSIAMHRFQISVFGAVAIVFAVMGVNQGIFFHDGALDAMSAGWLILAIVDILWVLYFTSEEDSLALHIFNSLGTGGLTPPSRRRRTRTQNSMHMAAGNGYASNYSGGGIGSHDPYDSKMGGSLGGGIGGAAYGSSGPGIRSQNSFNAGSLNNDNQNRSLGGGGSIHDSPAGGGPRSIGGGETNNPGSPLMAGIGAGGAGSTSASDPAAAPESYSYKAKALYAYTASPDDPNEISFSKGEILDIVDKAGKWWQARKADGTIGIAPSNYLQII